MGAERAQPTRTLRGFGTDPVHTKYSATVRGQCYCGYRDYRCIHVASATGVLRKKREILWAAVTKGVDPIYIHGWGSQTKRREGSELGMSKNVVREMRQDQYTTRCPECGLVFLIWEMQGDRLERHARSLCM